VAIGPVQLIVLGFNHPHFHGEIIVEIGLMSAEEAKELHAMETAAAAKR
jgi:hypothetical protein